jgi:hypothetical protein
MAGGIGRSRARFRFALNAPHKPRRRASLQRALELQQQIQKGDTSNGVNKGTFLKRFDTSVIMHLTQKPVLS